MIKILKVGIQDEEPLNWDLSMHKACSLKKGTYCGPLFTRLILKNRMHQLSEFHRAIFNRFSYIKIINLSVSLVSIRSIEKLMMAIKIFQRINKLTFMIDISDLSNFQLSLVKPFCDSSE